MAPIWRVVISAMDMENEIEYHAFFPGEITIIAGDSIWFAYEMPMFHTVTFASPEEAPPIFIPDPEVEAPATPDPTVMPKLILNPILLTGAGGSVVDGSQLVSTGVDVFSDPSVQWVFSFPTPGTYDYVCIPHVSNMQGRVVVHGPSG